VRRFSYKLQAAFERFREAEKAAERALAAAEAALAAERAALAALERKADTFRGLLRRAGSVNALAEIDRSLVALDAAQRQRELRVADAQRCRAEARTELAGARRRRSALERHRERALARHAYAAELREDCELEEFNAARTGFA
jgi:flagellar export protein FliJ